MTHTYAAVAFCTAGEARVELRGEWKLKKGDVLLVPAGEPHRALETNGQELWGLALCVPCFLSDGFTELLQPFERVRDGGSPVVRIPAPRQAYLEGLFEELERLGQEPGLPNETLHAVERSLITLALAEISKASEVGDAPRGAGSVALNALRFIERNSFGPLTLGDVAAAVGRSPSHVTTLLTKATGKSAVQWIVSVRMAQARRLLLHSDERIDIIAERVGYADVTHFIRMFRREHNETPAAWRSSHQR